MIKVLEVEGLIGGYGQVQVLRGISLVVPEGGRVGLFGPNGHGKTTLLKTISGLLKTWSGQTKFLGEHIERLSPKRIVNLGLIHVPQANSLFPEMGVQETLELAAFNPRARPRLRENLERVFTLFPRLAERRTQLCKTLSGGERQMLSIGTGLMCEPKMLILDEPTLGLAPKLKDDLLEAISKITDQGLSLLLVEQDIEFLLSLTRTLYMMDHGQITRKIASDAQLDHQEIMQMYFGTGAT